MKKLASKNKRNAFALVLAIGAMAFMVLLVLTLSSIVSAKMRLLNAQKENRMARSNALLGMSVAISELQRTMGPDNAISAPSTIFDTDPSTIQIDGVRAPYVIGAFPVETNKSSLTFYESQKQDREIVDILKEGKTVDDSNISWLISSEKRMVNPSTQSPTDLSEESVKLASYSQMTDFPTSMGGKVTPALKSETIDVEAGKITLEGGAYAWWVADESLKAKINLTRPKKYLDAQTMGSAEDFAAPADRLIPQVSYNSFIDEMSRYQMNPFLSSFDEDSSNILAKATSFDEIAMLDDSLTEWVQKNKNDYTVSSLGIPVDVTQGKLKEDLTVYLTKEGSGKGIKDTDSIIRGSNNDKSYTGPKFELDSYDTNLPKMGLLRDWATMLDDAGKKFEDGIKARSQKLESKEVTHGLYPIVTKATWTYRLTYELVSGKLGTNSTIRAYLVFYPRISIWNPHQVTIKNTDYLVRLFLPYALELGTFGEGYFGSDSNAVEKYLPPMALRYDYVEKEMYETKRGEPDNIRRFHPYKIYEFTGSNNAAQGISAPKNFNKTMAVTFLKILRARSLNRGTADHSTDDSSSVNGTPVLSMRVESLELKPGETLELVATDESGTMQTYNGTTSDIEVIPVKAQSQYPRLSPSRTVETGNKYVRGVGILIDTGLEFKERDNLVKLTGTDWTNTDLTSDFKTAVKPSGENGNPKVVANWRVVPLLNDSSLFSFVSDTSKTKQGHSYVGYELWSRNSGKYEYLTGLDTAMLVTKSKTMTSGKSDTNEIWHYSRTKAFNPAFPHIVTFSQAVPMRFSIGYAWNERADSEGLSYLNPKRDLSGYYGFMGNGGNNAKKYIQRSAFAMSSPTTSHCMTPLIPSIEAVQNIPWAASGYDSDLPKVPNTGNNEYLEFGVAKAHTNPKYTTTYNDVVDGGDKFWGSYGGAYAMWGITTLGPLKDKNSDIGQAGYAYMPPYMALMNPLRDNGMVPRVDAFHSYNLVPIDICDDGYGSRYYWKDVIFSQSVDRYWTAHNIDQTTSSQNIDTTGDWSYISKYNSDGGYRYGTPVLFYSSAGVYHGGNGFFSANAVTKTPTSFVMPVYDFVRNSEEVMSLGVFANANLSTMLWQPQRALGESWASPFIKREDIVNTQDKKLHENELIDLSYMLNASIWDRFYLSTIPQDGLKDPYAGMRMRNTRNILTSVAENTSDLYGSKDAFEKSASHIGIEGAFNVNSTSYEAWRAFLGSMLGTKKKPLLEDEYPKDVDPSTPTKYFMPNPGNLNTVLAPQPFDKKVGYRDAGAGRDISEAEIDELAREVVAEVKRRAPFFSLADFVNRRLMKYADASSDEDLSYQSLMGTLAAAIARISNEQIASKPTIFNADYDFTKKNPSYSDLLTMMRDKTKESIEQASMAPTGKYYRRGAGLPGFQLMQSQLLTAYAPFMTVRGDTFTIRAYGEYINPMTGTSAKAYCEALVQRGAETVEASDDIVQPTGAFGRKFKIVSFRWLTPAEL